VLVLTWAQLIGVAFHSTKNCAKRSGGLTLLLFIGYLVVQFSSFLVIASVEGERLVDFERFGGGDPDRVYVAAFSEQTHVDYQSMFQQLLLHPSLERVLVISHARDVPQWAALFATGDANGFPPLVQGRRFSRHEVQSDAPIALIGRNVASDFRVESAGESIRFHGKELTVIGFLASTMPVTGRPFRFSDNYLWLPLRTALDLMGNRQQELTVYLHTRRPLTEAQMAEMNAIMDKAADNPQAVGIAESAGAGLRREGRWVLQLIGVAIAGLLVLYGGLCLSTLVRYWVKRRQQELAIRMSVGATMRDVVRLVCLEQSFFVVTAYCVSAILFPLLQPSIRSTGIFTATTAWLYFATACLASQLLALTYWVAWRQLRLTALPPAVKGMV
jgi:hypothetical protein